MASSNFSDGDTTKKMDEIVKKKLIFLSEKKNGQRESQHLNPFSKMPPAGRQESKKADELEPGDLFEPTLAHLKSPTGLLMEACRAGPPLFQLGEVPVR